MPPPLVICARHSQRIDHMDGRWSLTAERPHDSPITPEGHVMSERLGTHLWPTVRDTVRQHLVAHLVTNGHVLPDLKGAAGASSKRDPPRPMSREAAEAAVAAVAPVDLLRYLVVWSSPLGRCIETADSCLRAMVTAAVAEDGAGSAPAWAATEPKVMVEPGLQEGGYWMSHDLKNKHGNTLLPEHVPHPILLSAQEHAANGVSARLVEQHAHRHRHLPWLPDPSDSDSATATNNGAHARPEYRTRTRVELNVVAPLGIRDKVKTSPRCRNIALQLGRGEFDDALVEAMRYSLPPVLGGTGAPCVGGNSSDLPAPPVPAVVLCFGHGGTVPEWVAGLTGQTDLWDSAYYTAYAQVKLPGIGEGAGLGSWVPAALGGKKGPGVMVPHPSGSVFDTPHLDP